MQSNIIQQERGHVSFRKIIYIADLIEEGRKFPVVDTLRELAYGGKLDEALLTSFNNTLMFVINKKKRYIQEQLWQETI